MPKSNLDSYPPLFHPMRKSDPNQNPIEQGIGMDPLPVIDVECLDENKLDWACREWGIFRVINHGVPIGLLRDLQDHARTIFDLPFESKQGLSNSCCPSIRYFWGTPALSPAGVALPRATAARNVDWVEGFNVPLAQISSSLDHDHDHDHDSLIIAFRNLLEEYRRHLTRLASTLFEAMVRGLGLKLELPRSTYLDESTELVRVYRYPRGSVDQELANGMHVHTDSSLLAILNEDQVGGLQFLKDDQWLDVKLIPSTLIINLGDMMQALSDDEYKSVTHKVKLSKQKERLSICYFVFPQENALIHTSKYKPFTYNDFRAQVQLDVKTVGRKIGLQNFKLPQASSNQE